MAPLDPVVDAESLRQKAVATQERYKFRFDVAKLAADWRIEPPKELKGDLLTTTSRGQCLRLLWPPLPAQDVANREHA